MGLAPEKFPPHSRQHFFNSSDEHLLVHELGNDGDVLQAVGDVNGTGGLCHLLEGLLQRTLAW